jgi:hypothetical protein
MKKLVLPDRPIWPPIPPMVEGGSTAQPQDEAPTEATAPAVPRQSQQSKPASISEAFEGFGSFSGSA